MARDQLSGMRGDISFIDNALHLAASLRANTAAPEDQPSDSVFGDEQMPSADTGTPARSLLARGSAADLQNVQNGILYHNNENPAPTAQISHYNNERPSKKQRLDIFETQHQHDSNPHELQQRLASRDAMPPPGRMPHRILPNLGRRLLSSHHQHRNQTSVQEVDTSNGDWCHSYRHEHEFSFSDAQQPTLNIPSIRPKRGSSGIYEGTAPAIDGFLWRQQNGDGELDQNIRAPVPGSRPSSISPTKRLTLPPRTPSLVNHATPSRQVGISANVRTSQPPFPTPESLHSLQGSLNRRAPGWNNRPAASPYFNNQALPDRATQSPFINKHRTAPTAQQSLMMTPRFNTSTLAPSASTAGKLSWLTSAFSNGQGQGRQRANTAELQNGSGAYRQPGDTQQSADQRLSINGFSFANQPEIKSSNGGRSSRVPYANHGRRAARR
ncbi:MAG: hypothetical protein Q9181_001722 [Wetmoreana brouardii]